MAKKNGLNKNKFLGLGLITLIIGITCLLGHFLMEDKSGKMDQLTYVEGQLDYSYTPWIYKYRNWSVKKRRRFKKQHFDIFLEDSHTRYTSGSTVLANLYEEPFYNLIYEYPRPDVVIGYLDTDDPYVKEVYSLEIDNLQLVDIDGVKKDLYNEKLILLVVGAFLSVLGLFFFFLHYRK